MRAGFWEILLIVVLVLILFGHNKIPDLMRNLASGINTFKKELKDDKAPAGAAKKETAAGRGNKKAASGKKASNPVKVKATKNAVKK